MACKRNLISMKSAAETSTQTINAHKQCNIIYNATMNDL